jgi:hypothetical protein
MGRNQGPSFTRRRVTRASAALALPFALLLAGCGGQSYVQVNSNNVSTSGASTGVSARFPGSSTMAALFSMVFLAGVSYEGERGMPRSAHEPYLAHALEPDPARRVAVQDCTKPIEDWSANLKCR